MRKFIQSINQPIFSQLEKLSKARGIDVQEFLRAVVIPEYLQDHPNLVSKKRSEAMKKGWETRRKNVEREELRAKNEAADRGTGAEEAYPKFPAGPTQ